MLKNDLIDRVHEKTGLLKKDIAPMVEATFEAMTEALKSGEKVKIANFGTFEKNLRNSYQGVHPVTGETIKIPSFVKVRFISSRFLKDNIK